MSDRLGPIVQNILQEFANSWTLDLRDLNKPSADEVLKKLISESPSVHHARLTEEFFGLGPLATLVERTALTECLVNGAKHIWFECDGRWHRHDDIFLSDLTYRNFIDRLCCEAQIKVDLAQPFADGRWRHFRVHLASAPLAQADYVLTLRRLPENPWTLSLLHQLDWCTEDQQKILSNLLHERKNILFIGQTGSGKTSVLGACLKELKGAERVVTLEDTPELPCPNDLSSQLLARPHATALLPEIPLSELVRQSLRMRPDRLVVGEVRGPEAKDLLLALATGHKGSLGTLHAAHAHQALLRLEMLVQLGAPQWNPQAVRQLIRQSVDHLVVCGFDENGKRRLHGISAIAGLESFGLLLETVS